MYEFSPLRYALDSILEPIGYGVLLAALFAAGAWLFWRQPFWKVLAYYATFGLPIGLIAFIAGLLTGLSRVPAVGTVLPAVLALIGGLSVYVFGTDNKYKVVVGYSIFVFVFMLLFGMETGSLQRESQREEYLIHLSRQEFRIRNFRRNLDLPTNMPSWIQGADSK